MCDAGSAEQMSSNVAVIHEGIDNPSDFMPSVNVIRRVIWRVA